uniref:Uncharacterized protein n=1 Tax=Syphacia muris TaxID=451379 RepID=A0A0N5AJ00_9BILA
MKITVLSCLSGTNNRYVSKQCSSGSVGNIDFMCQKFTCEGGRSPFVLRTCANSKVGCLAGPAICKISGGIGSCSRCASDNCNK